jgi:hypothetical protein
VKAEKASNCPGKSDQLVIQAFCVHSEFVSGKEEKEEKEPKINQLNKCRQKANRKSSVSMGGERTTS